MRMKLQTRHFDEPDERRSSEKGTFELVTVGGTTSGRARYEPRWKWSEHVAPIAGKKLCGVEHLGIAISGRAAVRMADGTELIIGTGEVFVIPPGRDSWVVGDQPYVSLLQLGAGDYATGHNEP